MFSLDRKQVKFGESRKMSELARRIDLHNKCNLFKKDIKELMIGKGTFIIDLVKSLKKVTDEWRGWNHQVFGMSRSKPYVAAIAQVRELVSWSEKTYRQTITSLVSAESYRKFTTDTLKKFLLTCKQLQELQVKFEKEILCPLKDFFNDESANKYILKLDLLQLQWKQLLSPGVVNSAHFSLESFHLLKDVEMHSSFYCFYLIIRLIPDLCFKAEKSILLVEFCLDTDNGKAYNRERNFLLNMWIPNQSERQKKVYDRSIKGHLANDIKNDTVKFELLEKEKSEKLIIISSISNEIKEVSEKETDLYNKITKCVTVKEKNEKLLTLLNEEEAKLRKEMEIMKQNIKKNKDEIKASRWFQICNVEEDSNISKLKSNLIENINAYDQINIKSNEVLEKHNQVELSIIQEKNKFSNFEFQIKRLMETRRRNENSLPQYEDEIKGINEEIRVLKMTVRIHSHKLNRIEKNEQSENKLASSII